MDFDADKVDDALFALLYLTVHREYEDGARSWKSLDRDARSRLHAKGMIGDHISTAKSFILTQEALAKSDEKMINVVA